MDVNVNVKIEAVELVTAVSTLASAIVSARNIKEHEKTGVEAVHAAPANPVPLASAVPVTPPPAAASVPAPNAAPTVPVAASVQAPNAVPAVPVAAPVPAPVPTTTTAAPVVPVASAPAYTLAQIMKAGASLMDAGKGENLVALLNRYGIKAINQLPPAQYGAIATELRALGAQI